MRQSKDNMDKTEELIEIVKHYPILYDSSHEDYKENRIKNKIWDSVAESLQERDGDVVKSRWKNLRDSYSKHLRAASGEENKYIERYRSWPWVSQMSFLQPFIEGIPNRANRGVKKCRTVQKENSLSTDLLQPVINQIIKTEESTSDEMPNEDPIFVDSHRLIEAQPDVSQYFNNDVKANSSNFNTMPYDETDLIFLGYSKLIKKMSRKQQAAVKYNIAKVIMDAEIEDAEAECIPAKKVKSYYVTDTGN